eukprot:9471707-Pyramimonas_sp.AAC.1
MMRASGRKPRACSPTRCKRSGRLLGHRAGASPGADKRRKTTCRSRPVDFARRSYIFIQMPCWGKPAL